MEMVLYMYIHDPIINSNESSFMKFLYRDVIPVAAERSRECNQRRSINYDDRRLLLMHSKSRPNEIRVSNVFDSRR